MIFNFKKYFLKDLPQSENPRMFLEAEVQNWQKIFPVLYKTQGFLQNKYHSEDLFTHLANAWEIGFTLTQDPVFALSCLFHDIGKVDTVSWNEKKQDFTFYKHEYVGAKKIAAWMMNNQFSGHDTYRVYIAIRHHQYRIYENTGPATIRRWLRVIGKQGWKDIRILRLVDRMANESNKDKPIIYKLYIETDKRINTEAERVWA
jgi:hypothetical protein